MNTSPANLKNCCKGEINRSCPLKPKEGRQQKQTGQEEKQQSSRLLVESSTERRLKYDRGQG